MAQNRKTTTARTAYVVFAVATPDRAHSYVGYHVGTRSEDAIMRHILSCAKRSPDSNMSRHLKAYGNNLSVVELINTDGAHVRALHKEMCTRYNNDLITHHRVAPIVPREYYETERREPTKIPIHIDVAQSNAFIRKLFLETCEQYADGLCDWGEVCRIRMALPKRR